MYSSEVKSCNQLLRDMKSSGSVQRKDTHCSPPFPLPSLPPSFFLSFHTYHPPSLPSFRPPALPPCFLISVLTFLSFSLLSFGQRKKYEKTPQSCFPPITSFRVFGSSRAKRDEMGWIGNGAMGLRAGTGRGWDVTQRDRVGLRQKERDGMLLNFKWKCYATLAAMVLCY